MKYSKEDQIKTSNKTLSSNDLAKLLLQEIQKSNKKLPNVKVT